MKYSTLAVLGGTGKSGKYLVREALRRGYKLKLLVRSPEKLGEEVKANDEVQVIKGDALNPSDVAEVISGTNAVVVMIGHTRNSPANLQQQASALVIDAMRAKGVRRLVDLTGAGVRADSDKPSILDRLANLALGIIDPPRLRDGEEHVELISSAEDIDWTVVRTGLQKSSDGNGEYKVGYVGASNTSFSISRGSLAQALLDILESEKYIHDLPYVSD